VKHELESLLRAAFPDVGVSSLAVRELQRRCTVKRLGRGRGLRP